jgi:hypothetical protein
MWKVPVVAALGILAVSGLLNLGLITIAGSLAHLGCAIRLRTPIRSGSNSRGALTKSFLSAPTTSDPGALASHAH